MQKNDKILIIYLPKWIKFHTYRKNWFNILKKYKISNRRNLVLHMPTFKQRFTSDPKKHVRAHVPEPLRCRANINGPGFDDISSQGQNILL